MPQPPPSPPDLPWPVALPADADGGGPESLDYQDVYTSSHARSRRSDADRPAVPRRSRRSRTSTPGADAAAAAAAALMGGTITADGAPLDAPAESLDLVEIYNSAGGTAPEQQAPAAAAKPHLPPGDADGLPPLPPPPSLITRRGRGPAARDLSFTAGGRSTLSASAAARRPPPPRRAGLRLSSVVKFAVTLAVGVAVGTLAVALAATNEALLDFKNEVVRRIVAAGSGPGPGLEPRLGRGVSLVAAAAFHAAWSATLAALATALVLSAAPLAAGSGVSLVMAFLNGNAVPGLLSGRTLAVKWVGTACSAPANMGLGVEAPLVHLGSATAHVFAVWAGAAWDAVGRWVGAVRGRLAAVRSEASPPLLDTACPTVRPPPPPLLYTDADRREFVSAGAAAGIAAAFGAPIGGVLFCLEEACTHWSRKVAWRCLAAAAAAVFTQTQLFPRWASGVLPFHGVAGLDAWDWLHQLPLLAAVAAGGGVLGAAFNHGHAALAARARARADLVGRSSRPIIASRAATAAAIAAVIVTTMFALSVTLGTCLDVPAWHDTGYGVALTCSAPLYNDLASLFFSAPTASISHLFSLGRLTPEAGVCRGEGCYFTLRSMAVLCPTYLAAMTLSSSLLVPGGLFMPALVVGGSFGGVVGVLAMRALPAWGLQPGLFAMVAGTAVLGGVFRSSLSLVVLVVEGTQSVKFLLGILLAAVVSNFCGERLHPGGVYESDLDADGRVVFLRPTPPPALYRRTAGSVGSRAVWAFREVESAAYVVDVLTRTGHNGFPVVAGTSAEGGEGGDAAHANTASTTTNLRLLPRRDGAGSSSAPVLPPLPPGDSTGLSESAAEEDEDGGGAVTGLEDDAVAASERAGVASRPGPLVGLALRSQVLVLLAAGAFCDGSGRALPDAALSSSMTSFPPPSMRELDAAMRGAVRAGRRPDAALAAALARARARVLAAAAAAAADGTGATTELFLDLRPHMDRAPLAVRPDAPAERAHAVFVALGLRHLVVTDARGGVRGLITRKDLDAAAGSGPWRRARQQAPPQPPPPGGLHVPSEAPARWRGVGGVRWGAGSGGVGARPGGHSSDGVGGGGGGANGFMRRFMRRIASQSEETGLGGVV